jgi:hypothetical protein
MEKLSMRAFWGRLLVSGLAGAAALLLPSPSLACKCAPPPPVPEALPQASAVFEGIVTQLAPVAEEVEVSLRVTRTWKGVSTETVRVRTRKDTAACGVAFEVGRGYLVYANQSAAADTAIPLEVLRCGRTRLAAEADEDFVELGLGVVQVAERDPSPPASTDSASATASSPQPPALEPAAGGCAGCGVTGARGSGWLLGLFLVALVSWRARFRL